MVKNSKPILTLKPTFIPWIAVASAVVLQIFFTIWGGLFFGGFILVGATFLGLNFPLWIPFVVFGIIFFIAVPFVSYYMAKKNYAKTKYIFYSDRLDYYEGFLAVEAKSIRYKDIVEPSLRKGVIQRMYNLGTIYLSTYATGFGAYNHFGSGIFIKDIDNPAKVYQAVKILIQKHRK